MCNCRRFHAFYPFQKSRKNYAKNAPTIGEISAKIGHGVARGRFIHHFYGFWAASKNHEFLMSLWGVKKWLKNGPWRGLGRQYCSGGAASKLRGGDLWDLGSQGRGQVSKNTVETINSTARAQGDGKRAFSLLKAQRQRQPAPSNAYQRLPAVTGANQRQPATAGAYQRQFRFPPPAPRPQPQATHTTNKAE